ncbi:MAG: serine hydrolase domain-containing protein [Dehalococcoidia bacterium]|nr:serine hydrolase domain-containing protein [Dehalococcoidia bacterium]
MTSVQTAINEKVHDLLQRQIADGRQNGVQVCVYRGGEPIVDTWAGTVGPGDETPVGPDTLFSSFSTTKGVAATMLHVLADRGVIDYDAPVARYWPDFAANGKENVTVMQAICHMAGIHTTPVPNTSEYVLDWKKGQDYVANATPAWKPGTATGYHAITFGWIIGGIIEHASGRDFQEVLRTEITEPLGIQDEMFIGIPDGVEDRLTRLQAAPQNRGQDLGLPPDHDFFKAMPLESDVNYNSMKIRKSILPSANGHFSARALARMYAALAMDGELDGARLVSPGRMAKATKLVTDDVDRVLTMPMRRGGGYFLGGPVNGVVGVTGPRDTAFGHSGAGGSTAFADPEVGLSIAVTINMMQNSLQGEGPTFEICDLIREELGLN